MRFSIVLILVLAVMTGLTSGVLASEREDTVMLNELVVTALKQSSGLDKLPLSSTLVTQAEAERLNMRTLRNISEVAPNFYIPEYGSRMTSSIYVRGLGARMEQPVVGMNVDNVPFLNKDAYDFDIADIAAAEVLRGPQSTLYGRNTMGGQINISTLSPLSWQGWRLTASAANGPEFKGSAGWYHRFKNDMGLSLVGAYSYSDGWFRNLYNGQKTDREHLWNVRAKYEWKPTSTFGAMNVLALSNLRQGGYPYEYVPNGIIAYNDTCFYRRFCISDGLTLRKAWTDFSLSSITSVQYLNDNMTLDQDFLPESYFTLTQKKMETSLTQELLLKGAKGNYWNMTTGAFLFYKHLNMFAPVTFESYGISQLIENHRNDANPDYPISWESRSFPLNSRFKIPTFGTAIYHQSDIDVGCFHFEAGLRLDYERVALSSRSLCNTGYDIYCATINPSTPEWFKYYSINIDDTNHLSRHFLQVLPKLAVEWNLSPDGLSNIYLNVAKGYKAGGYNTQMFSDILQQRLMMLMGIGASYDVDKIVGYKPEKSWNFELGAHLSALDNRLTAQADIFYINCTDQQLTMFPNGNTTGRIMTNAGKTRSYGAEVQCSLSDVARFSFNISYGYTNARFREFFNGITSYNGKYIPYAPQNTLFTQIVYCVPRFGNFFDEISLDINMKGTGKIYWNEQNSLHQPFYCLLSASATFVRGDLSLRIWGENITGTKYSTFYFVTIGNEFLQRGRPLRAGATLSVNI